MYTQMLVPLDGSPVAEQVLPYVRFLAKTLGIPVNLLQVIDPDLLMPFANPAEGRYIDTLVGDSQQNAREYLQAIARTIDGARVECLAEKGKPAEVLIERAAADKGTLIIMATHGRSGIQRWLLGSVADKVLHGATNHVLLVRAAGQGETSGKAAFHTAIVPLDGSPLAEQVLPYVTDLARRLSLRLILMRAYALPPAISPGEYGTYTDQLINQLEAGARDYLNAKVEDLKRQDVNNISSVVDLGYGAREIIELARKTPNNFIAMCTHGRSGIQRWVLGSVTERVVQHSGDPVLIVRAA